MKTNEIGWGTGNICTYEDGRVSDNPWSGSRTQDPGSRKHANTHQNTYKTHQNAHTTHQHAYNTYRNIYKAYRDAFIESKHTTNVQHIKKTTKGIESSITIPI